MKQFAIGIWLSYFNEEKRTTDQQKLCVPCPMCGAAIGVYCQMHSGFGRRKEAHPERKYYAIQAIEHGYGQYELLRTFIRIERTHVWQTSDSAA